MDLPNDLLIFWAKTSHDRNDPSLQTAYHPLICHLIDVAVVTRNIWDGVLPIATRNRINCAFGLRDARSFVTLIAGLHDLGKCSPPFTLRGRNNFNSQTTSLLSLYENTLYECAGVIPAREAPHGFITTVELPQILADDFGFQGVNGEPSDLAKQIGVLTGGHHGIFPDSNWINNRIGQNELCVGNHHWKQARKQISCILANLLGINSPNPPASTKLDNGTIMVLAGLISVADWIGSDTQFFPCAVIDSTDKRIALVQGSLEAYVEYADAQAREALNALGWLGWPAATNAKQFDQLFDFAPRGVQQSAIEISKELKNPGIVVVEAPMGEGKTEAAMFLADHFNVTLKQRGIYFALPTMATSDQMFGRVKEFLQTRFEGTNANIQLQLAHGHASLSAEFETMKREFRDIQGIYEECGGGGECVPQVVAAEWFTYRKRSMLAPFGVGTIDQALMAVLQTKHVFVRLFGLAHKTIIIDEVHAYDAYMSTLLERLLEWLAALGSPVILLSATLPKERRNKLIEAYQKGIMAEPRTLECVSHVDRLPPLEKRNTDQYPRISYATGPGEIKVRHIESSAKTQTLFIQKVSDDRFVADLISRLEKDGGCVAIICNTVKRAQDIFTRLSAEKFFRNENVNNSLRRANVDGLPILDLLHARFRYCDRKERTDRCLVRFGKPDGTVSITENDITVEKPVKRPHTAVLVSTQIIEQSLDLDFDLMISDLAPIDLLLQRSGRLQRHDREWRPATFCDELGKSRPELWIIEPEIKPDALPDFKNSNVYDKHINLRTWLLLKGKNQINIPGDVEDFIEEVYNDKRDCPDVSFQQFWAETKTAKDDKLNKKRRKAKLCRITEADDPDLFENVLLELEEDNPEVHKSYQALTRDDDLPSVSVIPLTQAEIQSFDVDAEPEKQTREFLMRREVKVAKWLLSDKLIDATDLKPAAWKKSPLLRHHRLLRLDGQNSFPIANYRIILDERLGLRIKKGE